MDFDLGDRAAVLRSRLRDLIAQGLKGSAVGKPCGSCRSQHVPEYASRFAAMISPHVYAVRARRRKIVLLQS